MNFPTNSKKGQNKLEKNVPKKSKKLKIGVLIRLLGDLLIEEVKKSGEEGERITNKDKFQSVFTFFTNGLTKRKKVDDLFFKDVNYVNKIMTENAPHDITKKDAIYIRASLSFDIFSKTFDNAEVSDAAINSFISEIARYGYSLTKENIKNEIYNLFTKLLETKIRKKKREIHGFDNYLEKYARECSYLKTIFNDRKFKITNIYVQNSFLKSSFKDKEIVKYKSLYDMFRNTGRFISITGPAGYGKSMFLKYISLFYVNKNEDGFSPIPIYIKLNLYKPNVDIIDFLLNCFKRFDPNIKLSLLKNALKAGQIMFLFDGFDEMDTTLEIEFLKQLDNLIYKYPQNYYVISSRPNYLACLNKFNNLEIQPFDMTQAFILLNKYRKILKINEDHFRNFMGILNVRATEDNINCIPLLLTLNFFIFYKTGECCEPNSINYYYKAFELLYNEYDIKNRKTIPCHKFDLIKTKTIISEFSYYLMLEKKLNFSLNDINTIIKKYDLDFHEEDVYSILESNKTLFYKEDSNYCYLHRSFQDFFAALFIYENKNNLETIRNQIFTFMDNEYNNKRKLKDMKIPYEWFDRFDNVFNFIKSKDIKFYEKEIIYAYLKETFDCPDKIRYTNYLNIVYTTIIWFSGNDFQDFAYNYPSSNVFRYIIDEYAYSSLGRVFISDYIKQFVIDENFTSPTKFIYKGVEIPDCYICEARVADLISGKQQVIIEESKNAFETEYNKLLDLYKKLKKEYD